MQQTETKNEQYCLETKQSKVLHLLVQVMLFAMMGRWEALSLPASLPYLSWTPLPLKLSPLSCPSLSELCRDSAISPCPSGLCHMEHTHTHSPTAALSLRQGLALWLSAFRQLCCVSVSFLSKAAHVDEEMKTRKSDFQSQQPRPTAPSHSALVGGGRLTQPRLLHCG